mgnify:CR=1 FL=1
MAYAGRVTFFTSLDKKSLNDSGSYKIKTIIYVVFRSIKNITSCFNIYKLRQLHAFAKVIKLLFICVKKISFESECFRLQVMYQSWQFV